MSQYRTQSPLDRVRRDALILSCVVILGVLAYYFVGDYKWIEAIYMVVITIATMLS